MFSKAGLFLILLFVRFFSADLKTMNSALSQDASKWTEPRKLLESRQDGATGAGDGGRGDLRGLRMDASSHIQKGSRFVVDIQRSQPLNRFLNRLREQKERRQLLSSMR